MRQSRISNKTIQFVVLTLVVFLCSALARATTVTGTTVSSGDGQLLTNARITAEFVPKQGTFGSPVIPSVSATTNTSGTFTMTLIDVNTISPSGGTWKFTVCPNATVPCTIIPGVTITGTTQEIGGLITSNIPSLTVNAQILVPKAYNNAEVPTTDITNTGALYWNTLDKTIHLWDGSIWTGLPSLTANNNLTGSNNISAVSITVPGPFGIVGAGDSRMAGNGVPAGQDLLTQISLQPQFAGHVSIFHNGAVGGATCSSMTSVYATNVQPFKPTLVTPTVYLFIEEGYNDFVAGTALTSLESCYQAYLNSAVSDGFIPVVITSYYGNSLTDAQDNLRSQFNDWLRGLPFLVIDADLFIPSSNSPATGLYGLVIGGTGATTVSSITGYTITGGTAVFTGTNTFAAGNSIYLTGFPANSITNSCLNNRFFIVSAAGLTTTSFQTTVSCPDRTSSDTGTAEIVYNDPTHLGPNGILLLAKAINYAWGVAKSGTTFPKFVRQNYYNPYPSLWSRFVGALLADQVGACNLAVASCPITADGYLHSTTGTTSGGVTFGGDSGSYFRRGFGGSGFQWQFGSEGGGVTVTGATSTFNYPSSMRVGSTSGSFAVGTVIPTGCCTAGDIAAAQSTALGRIYLGPVNITGANTNQIQTLITNQYCLGGAGNQTCWQAGAGAPTGACNTGNLFTRTDGAAGATLYVCQAGAWAAK